MSQRLMDLRGVPEDEANEVRDLLDAHAIEYYETPPNRWGISAGAIWLVETAEYERARGVLDEYQMQRSERVRSERQQGHVGGRFIDCLRNEPVRVIVYLAIVATLLYFTVRPFFGFGG